METNSQSADDSSARRGTYSLRRNIRKREHEHIRILRGSDYIDYVVLDADHADGGEDDCGV